MSAAADVLARARLLVADLADWRQFGKDRHEDDRLAPYCVGAAIYAAARRLGAGDAAEAEATRLFGLAIGVEAEEDELTEAIVDWNDARERSHSDVLRAFARAYSLAMEGAR